MAREDDRMKSPGINNEVICDHAGYKHADQIADLKKECIFLMEEQERLNIKICDLEELLEESQHQNRRIL